MTLRGDFIQFAVAVRLAKEPLGAAEFAMQRPVFLNADLTRLAQVLSNLLTNSAKYTDQSGKIQEGDREPSRAAGSDRHLVEPVTLAYLEKLLAMKLV